MDEKQFSPHDPEREWERFLKLPEDTIQLQYTNTGTGMLSEEAFEHLNDTVTMFVASRMYRRAQNNDDRVDKVTVQVTVECE